MSNVKREFILGDRVVLVMDAFSPRGECIPVGTVGTICGVARWLPQVDFGAQGVKAVAPHALQILDVPDGAPLPDDGQPLYVWDVLVATLKENMRLRRQLTRITHKVGW